MQTALGSSYYTYIQTHADTIYGIYMQTYNDSTVHSKNPIGTEKPTPTHACKLIRSPLATSMHKEPK